MILKAGLFVVADRDTLADLARGLELLRGEGRRNGLGTALRAGTATAESELLCLLGQRGGIGRKPDFEPDRLVFATTAARRMRVTPRRIRYLMATRRLPSVVIDGRRLCDIDDVNAIAERGD